MESKRIQQHQTLLDFAVQNAGDLQGLFQIAGDNGLGVTDAPAPGASLQVDVENIAVVSFFETSVDQPTTRPEAQPLPGGIGYMQIGNNFKVS